MVPSILFKRSRSLIPRFWQDFDYGFAQCVAEGSPSNVNESEQSSYLTSFSSSFLKVNMATTIHARVGPTFGAGPHHKQQLQEVSSTVSGSSGTLIRPNDINRPEGTVVVPSICHMQHHPTHCHHYPPSYHHHSHHQSMVPFQHKLPTVMGQPTNGHNPQEP